MLTGTLDDLAATGIASIPTLRSWLRDLPEDTAWIIKRGSRGDAYELDIAGAVRAYQAKGEAEVEAARQRAAAVKQLALDLGIGGSAEPEDGPVVLSIAERRQLLEEELVAIKLAEKRGELVPFVEVAAAFRDVLVRFRQRGETFAARLAKKIDLSRAQIVEIEKLIETDQSEMADWMERMEIPVGDRDRQDIAGASATAAMEDTPV